MDPMRGGDESAAPRLVLPPLLVAAEAWAADPSPSTRRTLAEAVTRVASHLDLAVARLRVEAPPLPALDLEAGESPAEATEILRDGEGEPIGSVELSGSREAAVDLVHALETVLTAARASSRARRAEEQLSALDQAVRGISGVLDVERVLQLITDRVRDLVGARYAALGIVDDAGAIERFITSGISREQRARIGELPKGRGLLGLIIRENRSYRIREIGEHPESYGFPPHHPPMHSFLGTPIVAGEETVGRLYLTEKRDAPEFSAEDEALVEMFAMHAGIAIENARLHDKVRRLAVVDERERISRDLHDSVIQSIYAQTLALDDLPELIREDPEGGAQRVDEAIDALHAVIRDIRNFIFGLRPVLLESHDLGEGLGHLATELRRSGGVEVAVAIDDEAVAVDALPIELVAEILAIVREALSNIARHAAAEHATVRLEADDDRVRLEIADDGRGFDAAQAAERGHHGLANMRARSSAIGGSFEVESQPEAGTRIIVSIPRRAMQGEG